MVFYADRFKKIRLVKRLSLQSLADATDISKSSVWAWEQGRRTPSEPNIRALARLLEVEVTEISNLKPIDKEISDLLSISAKKIKKKTFDTEKFINEELMANLNKLYKEFKRSSLINSSLLSTINIPFYLKNPFNKFIAANDAFFDVLNFNKNLEIFNKDDYDLFSQTEAKINFDEDQNALNRGNSIIDKESYIPGTRKKRWGLISKIPIINEENKIAGLLGVFVDITERKKFETANKLLLSCLINLPDGIVIYDLEKKKNVYLNQSASKILDCPIDILYNTGRDFWLNHNLSPEDRELALERSKVKKWPKVREQEIYCTNGVKKWVEVRNSVLKFDDEKEYVISIITDITQRKKDEKAIRSLEFAMNKIDEGVWTGEFKDEERSSYRFNYINKAVENIFGTSKTEMIENSEEWLKNPEIWADITPAEKTKINKTRFSNIWPRNYNYKAVRKSDNKEIWITERIYKHLNMTFGFARDVTDICKLNENKELLFKFLDMDEIPPFWLFEEKPYYRFLLINKNFENLLRRKKEDFYSDCKLWKKCVHQDDIPIIHGRAFDDKGMSSLKYRIVQPDNTLIPVCEISMKVVMSDRIVIGGIVKKLQ